MSVQEISSKGQFDQEIEQASGVAVVKAYAPFEQASVDLPGFDETSEDPAFSEVKFFKLDIETVPDVTQQLQPSTLPTVYIFKAGVQVADFPGQIPGEVLREMVNMHL
ncbi:hypothetical protein EJ05DRAFT_475730 [Pseudovirgaria hyperparasitica]|uniref:Thioredoxin domain-containing protein n=1 Tax=Pseudovirgaria hyperparasitica TaxID=470096 RepID=A0A6A6W8Q5_9PEZI|nr:uncharacterized protein EJ05DRAFT_475730 [Pseudovirgaria hyperparasitica]KAF2758414.1 hypothetical protein EJ05DRAFT_475730 [Pseudovirgaria hyperparasitica]